MNTHKNALLTPKGRAHLVSQITTMGLAAAAQAEIFAKPPDVDAVQGVAAQRAQTCQIQG